MSRNSNAPPMARVAGRLHFESDVDAKIVDCVIALFAGDAPTAVAFCALEAWSEGKQDEYNFWTRIFHRLRN